MSERVDAPEGRLIVGPFNRVEGDLEVRLTIADARVMRAEVVAPMYRGFEPMLIGRDPLDALVIVPRICGICSVSQSVAATRALADAAGIEPARNGRIATDLMLGCENAADHLTHFYVFFLPDFTRAVYADRPWHAKAQQRFAALEGEQTRKAIAARARWFELLGTLGGRWPHTHSIQPGGSARGIEASERLRLAARVREFRAFLERELYGAPLQAVLALDSVDALERFAAQGRVADSDLGLWLQIVQAEALQTLGPGPADFVACGGWGGREDPQAPAWPRGRVTRTADGKLHTRTLDLDTLTEDATHSWLNAPGDAARHPTDGRTEPQGDVQAKPAAYSWAKAPRLGGEVVETGALARQLVRGHPLVADAVQRWGSTVHTRVLGRLLELAALIPLMERLLIALDPGEAVCHDAPMPSQARGVGLAEAARGMLGHWLQIEHGRIANYQIVAPTSWNFSPRDAAGAPGALEAALVGAPVRGGERTPVAVQHIVRSFDPCMVCTAH